MSKYNIPDVNVPKSVAFEKYLFGDPCNNINEIKNKKPIFAFDFISINSSSFCFNSTLIKKTKEYHRFFESIKNISTKTYDDLTKNRTFHFHEVDFKDITISQSDFLKCIVPDISKINPDNSPTVYQFKTFEEARIFGFIHNMVFYPVFFDREHNAYKRK